MDLTPEQLIGGGQVNPQIAPTDAPNQNNPLSGAPPTSGLGPDPAATLLAGLPPAPPKGGISESPADQFKRQVAQNADSLIKQASDPTAPGLWARALVGGVTSAIGGLGSAAAVGKVEHGGGWLEGVTRTVNAQQKEQHQKQEDAAKAKQQQFENDYKQRELKDREDAQNAATLMNHIAVQKAYAASTNEAKTEMHDNSYKPWEKLEQDSGAQVIRGGMDASELKQLAKDHATKEDPNGTTWLSSQMQHQDGWRDVRDANGDIVEQKDPITGKPTGQPMRQATYALMTYGDPITITSEIANQAQKYGLGNLTEGTVLQPRDAALLKSQIAKAVVDEHASDVLELEYGKTKEQLKELQNKSEYRDAGAAFSPWLIDAKGNPGEALDNMRQHAQEVGPNGQPTPQAQQAKKQYDTVIQGLGSDLVKNSLDTFEKTQIENIKANAKAAKDNPLDVEGDPTLKGEAYINSLPLSHQPLIRQITNGQIGAVSPRLLAGKDGQKLMAEAALADPDLDTRKIDGYGALIKGFTTGKEAQQIKAINTALPHLEQMYNAIDNGFGTTLPIIGNIERKLGNQNAIDVNTIRTQGAQELASIYATGAVTDQQHKEFAKELDSWSAPELKGTLYTIAQLLEKRIGAMDNQWQEGLPSPHWRPKRAIVDADATNALNNIISKHEGKGPVAPSAPEGATHTVMGSDGKLHWTNDAGTQDFGVKQ